MKLLFDQNLSPWLCQSLAELFHESVHVRDVGLREATDAEIWDYAVRHDFVIVTKDADLRQRSFLLGHPPKVVWIRLGNCSTASIEAVLRSRVAKIEAFLADEQASFLRLS